MSSVRIRSVFIPTYSDHLQHVRAVLEILQRDQWQVKLSKCAFAQEKIAYLGYVISAQGVATYEGKITAVKNWPRPRNLKELRGYLGFTGYYRKQIRHYAIISMPLTALLKKGVLFVWGPAQQQAFQALKDAMSQAPVLVLLGICPRGNNKMVY